MNATHATKAIAAADLVRQVHAKYADDPLVGQMHGALWAAVKPFAHLTMTSDQFVAFGGGTPKTEPPAE